MDEVCSHIMSTLRKRLENDWHAILNQTLAELISGSRLQPEEVNELRAKWRDRVGPHIETWTRRQAEGIARRLSRQPGGGTVGEAELAPVVDRLKKAVRQLVLVQRLIDGELAPHHEKQIREELWLELSPQVKRLAQCYEKSAAKRGFEVDDLIQDASAHFQQVITRFNPEDPRRAMLGTWFDDVIENLFTAAVRPRKSDTLKRGIGGMVEEEASDEIPNSPKQSLRYVRDFRRRQEVAESLHHLDEVCSQLIENGVCPFERVLAFKLYVCEGLTYQEVAEVLSARGYPYGTTQMFNFVKEVKAHVQGRFQGQ